MKELELDFSQVVRLYLNDEEIKQFKTELDAIEFIQIRHPKQFSDRFIYEQIKKKNLNVEDWEKFPEQERLKGLNKEHYRGKNIDMINSINYKRINWLEEQSHVMLKFKKFNSEKENALLSGFCLIMSVYNGHPEYFHYDIEEFVSLVQKLQSQVKHYNTLMPFLQSKGIFFNNTDNYSIVKQQIDLNNPCVMIHGHKEQPFDGHAVTLFGYDNEWFYYYDNSKDCFEFAKQIADELVILDIRDKKIKVPDYYLTYDLEQQHIFRGPYREKYLSKIVEKYKFGFMRIKQNSLKITNTGYFYPDMKKTKVSFSDLTIRLEKILTQMRIENGTASKMEYLTNCIFGK